MAKSAPEKEINEHYEVVEKPRFGPGSDEARALGNPTDPRGDVASGNHSDPRSEKSGAKSLNPSELSEKESDARNKSDTKADTDEKAELFSGEESPSRSSRFRARLTSNARRKITIGVTAGVLGFGGIGVFSILQGPLQAIHLAQILQRNFSGQENVSSKRTQGLFRYVRTGDVGRTRVGILGSFVFGKTINELATAGIEISERNPISGAPKQMKFDVTKENSPLKGKTLTQIAEILEVNKSALRQIGPGIYVADLDATTARGIKVINERINTSVAVIGNGRIVTGLKTRNLRTVLNTPRLFSPLKILENKVAERITTRDARKAAERERLNKTQGPIRERALAAKNKLKVSLDSNRNVLRSIAGAVVIQAVICFVYDTADAAIDFNYSSVVLPSAVEGIDKIAVGAQTQSGNDFAINQTGNVVSSFEDEKGQTIWKSKALDSTANGGIGNGEDLPTEYAQAFSGDTTAKNIKDSVNVELFGLDVTGATCSTAGQVIGGLIGAVIDGLGIIAAAPTGGASLAAVAAKHTAQASAMSGAMYMFQKLFTKIISTDTVVPSPLSGALGGNLLAYGARYASNMSFMASGGIPLKNSTTSQFDIDNGFYDNSEFEKRSFYARLFDLNDYRSLSSRTFASINSTSLTQVPSFFSNIFYSAFSTPKISAAGEPYEWGFERYGIPQEILNNTNFDDPYANAEAVVPLFDQGKYIEKAKKCFGVEIAKTAEGWDATAKDEVNPYVEKYTDQNCGDISDENWRRVILFVFDTQLMKSIACYDGTEEACPDGGSSTTSTTTSATVAVGGTLTTGTRAELVDKILNSPFWSPQSQNPVNDIKNGVAKDKLLVLIASLMEQTKTTIRPSVIKTGHSNCSAGGSTSNHFSGLAIDLGDAGSTRSDMEVVYKWLYENRVALEINELIWDPVPPGTTTLKNGVTLKYDPATLAGHRNHIHVSVQGQKLLAGCPGD